METKKTATMAVFESSQRKKRRWEWRWRHGEERDTEQVRCRPPLSPTDRTRHTTYCTVRKRL